MKNTCEKYKLVTEWIWTADSSVWEEVRSMPMFDERAYGGFKYTHLHRCKKIGNDREQCTVSLRKINGVMQDSAALTFPYYFGKISVKPAYYQTHNYNLVE